MQLKCGECEQAKTDLQDRNNEELTSTDCDGVATVTRIDSRTRFCPWVYMTFDGEHSLSNFSHLKLCVLCSV